MNENDVFLVAVVEVDYDKRILCQAPGCGRSVYRKIHIVLESAEFALLGSDCYRRIYGNGAVREPVYSWSSDRRLTDEERQQLIENTAAFIEQLEQELVSSSVSANFAAPCQRPRLLSRGGGGVVERQQIADIVTVGAAWQLG